MNKKNLLFVFADQWRGSAIGYAGEDPVQTPVMTAFVKNRFTVTMHSAHFRCVPLIGPAF